MFSDAKQAELWQTICSETRLRIEAEPLLASFFHSSVLHHTQLSGSLSHMLASMLQDTMLPAVALREIISEALDEDPKITLSACADLHAIFASDPACRYYSTPFLFYKGFHGLQGYRVAHWMWTNGRHSIAQYLQSRISSTLGLDIHPAARISSGVFIDHGSSVVIGETCVIEDNVTIYQDVTLGGTGKEQGDRHPKIRAGALISSGARVLGNIEVGAGAKVAAGSVVLEDVAANTTVAGIPARTVRVADINENDPISRWAKLES